MKTTLRKISVLSMALMTASAFTATAAPLFEEQFNYNLGTNAQIGLPLSKVPPSKWWTGNHAPFPTNNFLWVKKDTGNLFGAALPIKFFR